MCDADAEVAEVVPVSVEGPGDDQHADGTTSGGEHQQHDGERDGAAGAHAHADANRIECGAHRSISPTTMSVEPSVTIASGSDVPTAS